MGLSGCSTAFVRRPSQLLPAAASSSFSSLPCLAFPIKTPCSHRLYLKARPNYHVPRRASSICPQFAGSPLSSPLSSPARPLNSSSRPGGRPQGAEMKASAAFGVHLGALIKSVDECGSGGSAGRHGGGWAVGATSPPPPPMHLLVLDLGVVGAPTPWGPRDTRSQETSSDQKCLLENPPPPWSLRLSDPTVGSTDPPPLKPASLTSGHAPCWAQLCS